MCARRSGASADRRRFHRQDFHDELQHAIVDDGPGPKCKIAVNHRARNIDVEKGVIEFDNGTTVTADLIVGADGIRVRR